MLVRRCLALVLLVALPMALVTAGVADAQLAVSANDAKVELVNGRVTVLRNPPPDTVSLIDLKASPPRVIAEVEAPVSVVGPPLSVAITPDEGLALVTASMRIDPADPTKQTPHHLMSVIDLKARPPKVVATLEAGKGASGVSINRQGTLALVSNRGDGTVSIFTIQGRTVTPAGVVEVGGEKAGGGHVAFAPDGRTALVSRDRDHRVSVLAVDGTKVEYTKRDMNAGIRPVVLDIAANGAFAVAGSLGHPGTGDNDTVSLIDMRAKPPRVVDTVSVGQVVEGVKVSPDSAIIAAVAQDGSNRPKDSPFFNPGGKLVLYRATGGKLAKVAEARIGHWPQGAAFSSDGRTILVGNMVEKALWVFAWDGTTLRDTGQRIALKGGPAAVRIADR
jgi:DNA-binding beta-propeller fold protein YncE